MINRPTLLLADEPTGNLDTRTGAEILELLQQLRREESTTVVFATHDEALAGSADRVVRLLDGRLIAATPHVVTNVGNVPDRS